MGYIPRLLEPTLRRLFDQYPIVTISGPRQSGKTTLARACFPDLPYANFEQPDTREYFQSDPRRFLAAYRDGAIFDEVQRVPSLGSWLQAMVDEDRRDGRFILTGSAQFEVMNQVSQSLAGRTAILRLLPFSMDELARAPGASGTSGGKTTERRIYEGFYPRIQDLNLDPSQALSDYVQTYIERDLRQFGNIHDLSAFQRFLRLCAGRAGQLLNLESLGEDTGISGVTARSWMSILEASYIAFLLPPWFENIGKRLVKSPKLYFYDVGIAAWLCGIEKESQLQTHPLRGNLFENLVVADCLKRRYNAGRTAGLHFFRDARGVEVDLLYPAGNRCVPVEIKSGSTVVPDFMRNLEKLGALLPDRLEKGIVAYGGTQFQDREKALICPYTELSKHLPPEDVLCSPL